ncbi:MAG: hypothetical protein RLZZ01_2536 [Actinomycetota bacterium]
MPCRGTPGGRPQRRAGVGARIKQSDWHRPTGTVRPVVRVVFTANLQRHVPCPPTEVDAVDVRGALDAVFVATPRLRGYVLDERGALRKHMSVFVDGEQLRDRLGLTDEVGPTSEIYVMQALSGG